VNGEKKLDQEMQTKANDAQKDRKTKEDDLKEISDWITSLKSDMSKSRDILEALYQHKVFLDNL
jgi:hypothetical protein